LNWNGLRVCVPGHLTGGLGAELAGWLAGGGRHGWWTAWLAGGAGLATDLDGWLEDWWTGNGSVPEWQLGTELLPKPPHPPSADALYSASLSP